VSPSLLPATRAFLLAGCAPPCCAPACAPAGVQHGGAERASHAWSGRRLVHNNSGPNCGLPSANGSRHTCSAASRNRIFSSISATRRWAALSCSSNESAMRNVFLFAGKTQNERFAQRVPPRVQRGVRTCRHRGKGQAQLPAKGATQEGPCKAPRGGGARGGGGPWGGAGESLMRQSQEVSQTVAGGGGEREF
jgi:hypothetical protein